MAKFNDGDRVVLTALEYYGLAGEVLDSGNGVVHVWLDANTHGFDYICVDQKHLEHAPRAHRPESDAVCTYIDDDGQIVFANGEGEALEDDVAEALAGALRDDETEVCHQYSLDYKELLARSDRPAHDLLLASFEHLGRPVLVRHLANGDIDVSVQ